MEPNWIWSRKWMTKDEIKKGINKKDCSMFELGCICEDCTPKHREKFCTYGNPCGPEDWDETCSCVELEYNE